MNQHIARIGKKTETVSEQKNVLGGTLNSCRHANGAVTANCPYSVSVDGQVTLCGIVTQDFLDHIAKKYPRETLSEMARKIASLKVGKKCCIATNIWYEAYKAGCAPPVILESTHADVLTDMSPEVLTAVAENSHREF